MSFSNIYRHIGRRHIAINRHSVRARAAYGNPHRSTISRFLNDTGQKTYRPSYDHLLEIMDAIGVDRMRSFICAEILRDPEAYDHPGVHLLAGVLPQLAKALTGPDSKIREAFSSDEVRISSIKITESLNYLGDAKSAQKRRFEELTIRK